MRSSWALELQDSALAIARDGAVLSSAPSDSSSQHLARVLRGELAPGTLAQAEAELRARLRADAVDTRTPLWCVTPALPEPSVLGAILSLSRRADAAIGAFIDGATLSASTLSLERDALVLEVGLHHLAVTSVAAGEMVRKRRSVASPQGGWVALSRAWLDLIRAAMVNRTRVDPLRDAATERRLLEDLPALARQAAEHGSAVAAIEAGTQKVDIELTRDQLVAAAEPVLRELARLIEQLRVPGIASDIVLPHAFAVLPGFAALLDRAGSGGRQFLLADGYAAAAASLLPLPQADTASPAGTVPYLRRMRAAMYTSLEKLVEPRDSTPGEAPRRASHLIWQGRAVPLGATPIVVGRGATPGLAIALPEDSAGISRRHCTFVCSESEVALIDHSRFGTFVNDARVIERAAVRAGDRIRLGDPGFELDVVAADRA